MKGKKTEAEKISQSHAKYTKSCSHKKNKQISSKLAEKKSEKMQFASNNMIMKLRKAAKVFFFFSNIKQ